jgi:LacI family transcriptional regulator
LPPLLRTKHLIKVFFLDILPDSFKRLSLNGIRPDAIFACNDQMATDAIYAAKEYGLNVPDNIKIVGFDNTFVSSIINPQLTTVNVPKFRMGEEAFSLLYKRISENKKNSNTQANDNKSIGVELPIDLIIRQSTDQNAQSSSWNLEDW